MSRPILANANLASPWAPIVAVLGAAALARAAMGLEAYPFGDDFVYGPLARFAADPTLYPGDEQLRSFGNHAWAYAWIWRAADATIGVAPAFLALTLAISGAVGLGALAIMRAVGAAGALAGPALWLAVVVEARGVGRGDYGGAFTDHFHMQGVAIALCLFALAAALAGRSVWAGLILGVAAVAHPLLAFHSAIVIGFLHLAEGRAGLRPLLITGLISAAIAAPAHASLLFAVSDDAASAPTAEVIRDGYFFRARHHYAIPFGPLLVMAAYAVLGFVAAAALGARRALGAMAGLAALGAAVVFFHAADFNGPFREAHVALYIFDLTRSSPMLWVVAAALGFAAVERRAGGGRAAVIVAALIALVAILNLERSVWGAALALGAAFLVFRPSFGPRLAPILGAVALIWVLVETPVPRPSRAHEAGLTAWVKAETGPAEMIIAPPLVANLREETLRPLYIDFRMVSMAQPAHVWLARQRFEEITPGFESLPPIGGWEGAREWTLRYAGANTPALIAGHLARTGAAYFVTYVSAGHRPEEIAAAGLAAVYRDEVFVIYRRLGG